MDDEFSAPSARGLFKATGKKSKMVPVRLLDGTYTKIPRDEIQRTPADFYPTVEIEPTLALVKAEEQRLRQFSTLWECAAGNGVMAGALRQCGFDVVCSDLIDRNCGAEIKSFYDYTKETRPSFAAFTNPPYSECNWRDGQGRWISHAMQVLELEYMALLLSWNWPGAGGLRAVYDQNPPARVYLMRWKIDFSGEGSPPMLNAWFVWDKQHNGETVLRMLDRIDARQFELEI